MSHYRQPSDWQPPVRSYPVEGVSDSSSLDKTLKGAHDHIFMKEYYGNNI